MLTGLQATSLFYLINRILFNNYIEGMYQVCAV